MAGSLLALKYAQKETLVQIQEKPTSLIGVGYFLLLIIKVSDNIKQRICRGFIS